MTDIMQRLGIGHYTRGGGHYTRGTDTMQGGTDAIQGGTDMIQRSFVPRIVRALVPRTSAVVIASLRYGRCWCPTYFAYKRVFKLQLGALRSHSVCWLVGPEQEGEVKEEEEEDEEGGGKRRRRRKRRSRRKKETARKLIQK